MSEARSNTRQPGRQPDMREIRDRLIGDIARLVQDLAPGGKFAGEYYLARNPTRDDRRAGSFWIRVKGGAIGAWRDEATGETGDVVSLVQYCRRLSNLAEARREALTWLGAHSFTGPAPAKRELSTRPRSDDDQDEAKRKKKGGERALGLWLKAEKITPATFPGSLLERYLLSRGLDLATHFLGEGRELPGALRLFAAHDYYLADADGQTGELLTFPCMAALMTGPDGRPQALHRTWLAPDGAGKAQLPDPAWNKARKILGPPKGAVIRIAKGHRNLTPEEAARQGVRGPLVITEGIEDAIAVSIALPHYRIWAAGTLGNIGEVPILPCIESIVVAADNDAGKPQALATLERGIQALKRSGRPVAVTRLPGWAKDMNDLLKGERV